MENFNWTQFIIILVAAILGAIAVLPYVFELNKDKIDEAPMSTPLMVLVSIVQGSIVFAVVTFLGLLAAGAVGLSITSPLESFPLAIIAGGVSASILVSIEIFIFQPHLPPALKDTRHTIPFWKRFLATFYGGISEEVLTRLFLVSGLTWLLGQLTQSPTEEVIGIAIVLSAILFGIGHLPVTASMTKLTPLIIARAIILNAIIGLVCGWLFWQYSFVTAMIAHYTADVVLHLIAPSLMQKYVDNQEMTSMQPV